MGFAGGDSKGVRGLHLGNRQSHSKERTANVAGIEIQLGPIATPFAIII